MILHVCLKIQSPEVEKFLADDVLSQPGLRRADKDMAVEPNIYFLDDGPGAGNMLEKIRSLRLEHPQACLFVISSDASPEQIVEVMKAGANEYFMKPINPQKIREAISRVQLQLLERGKNAGGKSYAFIGSKGGIGTTVLAVNTAAAMAAQKSNKVALLDFDLAAGDSSVLVDLVPKTTMTDVIRNFDRLDSAFLAGVMEKTGSDFDLLAAPTSPEEGTSVSAAQIGRIFQHARRLYDTLVIDCPAMAGEERILEILRGVETTFLITDLSVPAVHNTSRHLKFLRKADIKKTEVVVNRFLRGQTATLEEVEKTVGHRAFWLFPNDYENVIAAVNRGTPLPKYNPRSALARNIAEFIQKLQNPAAFPHYRGVKGLLGKAV
ncbi:MAG: AAA family ATPase [Desulfuromonadales bacterium]